MFGREKMPSIKKEMERVGTPERKGELVDELKKVEGKAFAMYKGSEDLWVRARDIRRELKRDYGEDPPPPEAPKESRIGGYVNLVLDFLEQPDDRTKAKVLPR